VDYAPNSSTFIRTVLVADVTTHLLFVESNGRDRVSTRPEMFSGEVPFFALHSSNGYRALALDESNHRSDCVLYDTPRNITKSFSQKSVSKLKQPFLNYG
jgi:hypothetical protein